MTRWQRVHIEIQESILTVLCQKGYIRAGVEAVRRARAELKAYLQRDPVFGTTHVPHVPLSGAPEIARRMAEAGRLSGTGPMAAVAGAVAKACVRGLVEAGAPEAVADNGGDIVLFLREPVHIGLWAGPAFPTQLALAVPSRRGIFGLCTSSGTVGHSFSYGRSDAATVLSADPLLADAAATALGNRIRSSEDLEDSFQFLSELPGIEGALAVCQGRMALWGSLPEIVKIDFDPDLITRGRVPVNVEN